MSKDTSNYSWQRTSETNTINYAAKFCKEKEATFGPRYKSREKGIRHERIHAEDAYLANLVMPMVKTFVTRGEIWEAKMILWELKYNNIAEYLQDCQTLNQKIRRSGNDWREVVEQLLPARMI